MRRSIAIFLSFLVFAMPATAQDLALFMQGLNAQRVANGLGPLEYNPRLAAAAETQAQFMAQTSTLTHSGPGGSSVGDRVRGAGFCWRNIAENVALQPGGEADVITAWMNSPPHRQNILNRRVQEFGFARAEGNYWVLVLARGRNC